MALSTYSPSDPSDPDTKTPSSKESHARNGNLPNSNNPVPASSEGNANIPQCRNAYEKGSDDDLASKGLLGKSKSRGRK